MTSRINFIILSLIAIIIFLMTLALAGCSESNIEPDDGSLPRELTYSEKEVLASSENFGLKIFQELAMAERETNIFISPLSISMALSMTINGANTSTYDAIQNTLGLGNLSLEDINQSNKDLTQLLIGLDNKVKFSIANSIWFRNSFTFKQDFIQRNTNYYQAEVRPADFDNPETVNLINSWINGKTNGKIKEVLDSIDPSTVMYLINALYFKGDWQAKFDPNKTTSRPFYDLMGREISCEMMDKTGLIEFYEEEDFQAADLLYGSGHFSMTILLPSHDKNITDMITTITSDKWSTITDGFQETEMQLIMPKFKTEYKRKLKEILTMMGMEVAFTDNADFTGMREEGQLLINDVIHKTFVEVNEEGTEAAAVTVVDVGVTSAPPPLPRMVLDHPFVYVIRERETGTILFIGQLMNPNA